MIGCKVIFEGRTGVEEWAETLSKRTISSPRWKGHRGIRIKSTTSFEPASLGSTFEGISTCGNLQDFLGNGSLTGFVVANAQVA